MAPPDLSRLASSIQLEKLNIEPGFENIDIVELNAHEMEIYEALRVIFHTSKELAHVLTRQIVEAVIQPGQDVDGKQKRRLAAIVIRAMRSVHDITPAPGFYLTPNAK